MKLRTSAARLMVLAAALAAAVSGCERKETVFELDTGNGGIEVERDKDTGDLDIEIERGR